MQTIELIALDLDGTLFNNHSIIPQENIDTINQAIAQGVTIVISTGRPFSGLPFEQLSHTNIQYAITANGSAIYEIATKKLIYEDCMENSITIPIINFLMTKHIHMDAFIEGNGYSPQKFLKTAQSLKVPESLKHYIIDTRTRVDSIVDFITEHNLQIQKMTLNFATAEDGTLIDRDEVQRFLLANPNVNVVCGGYNNLEFTKAGVDKGVGLRHLSNYLGIPIEHTLAIGDTENDLAILKAAHIGVAMANATPEVKKEADYITLSNEESGVAAAIRHFLMLHPAD